MDAIINRLRQTDDEPHDNRYLARIGWVLIAAIGVFIAAYGYATLTVSEPASELDYGPFLKTIRVSFIALAVWTFASSLVWPARKIEAWLDARYPDHAVDDLDYSSREDLVASTVYSGLWSFRLLVAYAVIAGLTAMLSFLQAMQEAGYALESGNLETLTVLNTFALGVLTILLAGVAFFRLIEWSMAELVEEFCSPENSVFERMPQPAPEMTDRAVTDGGASDGD